MRPARGIAKLAIVAAVFALAASVPARAEHVDLSYAAPGPRPSAESGKPAARYPAEPAAPGGDNCVPALPCGSRLYGTLRRNGAVELQVPAMRW